MLSKIKLKYQQWTSFKHALRDRNKIYFFIVDTAEMVIVALVMALIIRHYVIQTSVVPSGSMIPTFQIKDRLFVNRFIYRFSLPERGDIVVFKSPNQDGRDFVKRCVGLPGDTLQVKEGEIYINGKLLVFPGVNVQFDQSNFGPIVIPDKSYFMMGDNRGNSWDSRFWGFVPESDLLGKAMFTFWPISRMHILR